MPRCWVYILESEKDGWIYTGHTKDIKKRLREHNLGKMGATRSHRPFRLVFAEELGSRSETMQKERFLKSGQGRSIRGEILHQGRQTG